MDSKGLEAKWVSRSESFSLTRGSIMTRTTQSRKTLGMDAITGCVVLSISILSSYDVINYRDGK